MKGLLKTEQCKYKDIRLFVVLIPLINALNYYLTYTHIPFNWHTLLTFSFDTLQGYAAWWGIRSVIIYMDKKMPYGNSPIKRIVVQLISTTIVALAIIIVSTEIINRVASDRPVPGSFYSFDIFIFISWFFVINGIYVGLHYFNELRQLENLRQEEKKIRNDGFIVKQGKQKLSVSFIDIRGFYVKGDYAVLVTVAGRKHLLDQSLDKVEKLLPPEFFFRLNRQYILHRSIITGFESAENGKINIIVNPSEHLPATIQMSRLRAPAFRSWFQPAN